jgi:hypothetical protein
MPTIPRTCCGGKIRSARFPTLILEDGRAPCDSSVTVQYSRRAHGRRQDHPRRRRTLRGVDAAVARRWDHGRGNATLRAALPRAGISFEQMGRTSVLRKLTTRRGVGGGEPTQKNRRGIRRFCKCRSRRLRTCSSHRRGISKGRGRCWSGPAFPRSRSWIASAQRDTRL